MGEKVQQVLKAAQARRLGEDLKAMDLEIADAQRLSLAPDDILVICLPGVASFEQRGMLTETCRAAGHSKIMILEGGATPMVIQARQNHEEVRDQLSSIMSVQRLILDLLGPDVEPDESEEKPAKTLDGQPAGGERDQSQSLG